MSEILSTYLLLVAFANVNRNRTTDETGNAYQWYFYPQVILQTAKSAHYTVLLCSAENAQHRQNI